PAGAGRPGALRRRRPQHPAVLHRPAGTGFRGDGHPGGGDPAGRRHAVAAQRPAGALGVAVAGPAHTLSSETHSSWHWTSAIRRFSLDSTRRHATRSEARMKLGKMLAV